MKEEKKFFNFGEISVETSIRYLDKEHYAEMLKSIIKYCERRLERLKGDEK